MKSKGIQNRIYALEKYMGFLKRANSLMGNLDDSFEGIVFRKYIEFESIVKVKEYLGQVHRVTGS